MSDVPPPAKKIRSCSSSESTPVLTLDEATANTLLDTVRRYEAEATRRHHDAQTELASANDDVHVAMEALKRAHERLHRVEATASHASRSAKAAQDYLSKWEMQLTGKASINTTGEHADDQKHVSFAVPQHHTTAEVTSSSPSVSSGQQRRVRRKRIRVSEHGWGVYEGHLDSLGEPHGRGTVTWENGGKYDGEWVDGKANGHGIMNYGNGDKYKGGWKDGCRFGQGTHHFKDGGVYEGQWCNAAPDGQGKMTLKNGSHYEGTWKDGKW